MKALNTKAVFLIKLGISLAMLWYVATRIDFKQMGQAVAQANLWWFALSLVLGFVQRFFCAWQVQIDCAHFGICQSLSYIFKSQLAASFYALTLPGDLAGGGVTWHYLSRSSGMRAQTAALLVFLRLVNLLIIASLATFGVLFEPKLAGLHLGPSLFLLCLLILFLILPFYVPVFSNLVERVCRGISSRIPLRLGRQRIEEASVNVFNSIRSYGALPLRHIAIICGISIMMNVFAAGAILMCFWAAGIPASAATALWVFSVLVIVQSLPISFAGVGVRDIGAVFILGAVFGTPPENALLFSSLIFLTALLIGLTGGWVNIGLSRTGTGVPPDH